MPQLAIDWLHLLLRWLHVVAAIMWIGDSFLFMWMDSNLSPPSRPRTGAVAGELWMVHSGGFYEVVKRRFLAPDELPQTLYWFKWQAYGTWITGFLLVGIVYYFGGGIFLVDRTGPHLGTAAAIAASLAVLFGGWLVYDALWSSPLARRPGVAIAISCALLGGVAFGLTRLFSGRAAFLHFGAMLGTIMAANVWRRIIPAQDQMLAATRAGTPVDVSLGARAKQRSTHNHYLTLPVLFTMLSNHFPMTYGHPLNWLLLILLTILGASIKYVMNFRLARSRWIPAAGIASLLALIALTARPAARASTTASGGPQVPFAAAQAIVERRCLTCHSEHPTNPSFPEPPSGIKLDSPERMRALAPRIQVRAVETKTMPLGNLTGMTDAERDSLGAWIAQGARLDGAGAQRP